MLLARQVASLGHICVVLEKNASLGGVWYAQANTTSRVNTSEAAYRIVERGTVINTDHTPRAMIMADIAFLASMYLNH